jgi:hypothetical protein
MPEQSIFQKIAGIVSSYAPGIATLLAATGVGAPIAAAVGAVGVLAKTLGMPETAKPEDILATIQSMPDSELKLKFVQAENDFQLKKRDQDIEELKTALSDVQDARSRQEEHEKATGKSDVNLYCIAWLIIIGFFVLMGLLLKFTVPEDQNGVIFMLFGALSAGFGQVLTYFFGSSKGSADKSLLLSGVRKSIDKK